MNKHTPGPWVEFRDADSHDIIAPDGVHIARMEPRNSASPLEDQDADARLIAAAPDLLAALEACESFLMDGTPDSDVSPLESAVRSVARAAIRKARGEA